MSTRAQQFSEGWPLNHNRHDPKKWGGGAVPVSVCEEAGPHLTQCGLDRGLPPYQVASSSTQPFGHNRHEPKSRGAAVPLSSGVGSWVPIWHNVAWAKAYLRTKWHLDPSSRLATRGMGLKLGAVPLFWGSAGSTSKMSPVPRPTSIPNDILIHQAVWQQ